MQPQVMGAMSSGRVIRPVIRDGVMARPVIAHVAIGVLPVIVSAINRATLADIFHARGAHHVRNCPTPPRRPDPGASAARPVTQIINLTSDNDEKLLLSVG